MIEPLARHDSQCFVACVAAENWIIAPVQCQQLSINRKTENNRCQVEGRLPMHDKDNPDLRWLNYFYCKSSSCKFSSIALFRRVCRCGNLNNSSQDRCYPHLGWLDHGHFATNQIFASFEAVNLDIWKCRQIFAGGTFGHNVPVCQCLTHPTLVWEVIIPDICPFSLQTHPVSGYYICAIFKTAVDSSN